MPSTKPINQRLQDVFKAVDRHSQKASKGSKTANTEQLKAEKMITAELTKQSSLRSSGAREQLKIEKQISAEIAKRAKSGGGGSGGSGRGGGSGGGGRSSGRGLGVRMPNLKALPGLAASHAVGRIIGMITGQMRESISTYTNTLTRQRDMAGFIGRPELGAILAQSAGKGFGLDETLSLTGNIGRVTGSAGPGRFNAEGGILAAQKASTEMGIDTGVSASLMGVLRQAGFQGFDKGQAGLKMFEKTLAAGTASGLEKTRVPEHMANMQKGVQMMGDVQAGVVDVASLNRTFAMLGQLGSGFQGQRGFQTFQAFQNMTTQVARGGGSQDVQALALQDIGGYGGPGSKNSYFQALEQLEKGATPDNIRNSIQGILRRYGASEEGALALGRSTGLSLSRSKQLLTAEASGGLGSTAMNRMIDTAAEEAKPVDEKLLDEAKKQSENQFRIFDQGAELSSISMDISTAVTRMSAEMTPILKDILSGVRQYVHDFEAGMDIVREMLHIPPKTEREKAVTADIRQLQQTMSGPALLDTLHRKRQEFEHNEMRSGNIQQDFADIQQQFVNAEQDARADMRIAEKSRTDYESKVAAQKLQRDEYKARVAAEAIAAKAAQDAEAQKSSTDAAKAVTRTQAKLAANVEHTATKTAQPPSTVSLSAGDTM